MQFDFKRPPVKEGLRRIGVLTLVIGAAFIAAQLVGAVVGGILAVTGTGFRTVAGYSLAVIAQGVGFIVVSLVYLSSKNLLDIVPVDVPDSDDIGWMVGGFFAIVLLAVVAGVVVQQLGIQTAQNKVTEIGNQNPQIYLALIPLSFLAIGTSEELLFRGLVQKRLEPFFGTGGAIVVGCLMFAGAHVFALQGGLPATIATIGVLFVVSTVFGVAYAATSNLLVPIIIHGAYNAVIFAVLYYDQVSSGSLQTLLLLLPF